jgi:ribosomal RNA-processing protein 8
MGKNRTKKKSHIAKTPSALNAKTDRPEQRSHVNNRVKGPQVKSMSVSMNKSTMELNNKKLTPLQIKYEKKLEGAKFRVINEKLYTTTGEAAYREFQQNPQLFDIYHQGFREQASAWPYNPLDGIIEFVMRNGKNKIIADIGCGDARLAASVPNIVHSFDLVAANNRVVACDMAHLPLPENSVDVAVFCLSLMGTNILDFIKEAHRILKVDGVLKIAEVRSRFEALENGGIKSFINALKKAGFDTVPHARKNENTMFFEIECTKSDRSPIFTEFTAKACLYKKR